MNAMLALLFETSPFTPFLSAWLVGFCDVDFYGQVFLTSRGEAYLDGLNSCSSAPWWWAEGLAGGLGLVGAA